MLEVKDIVTAYGKIEALKGVSLSVSEAKITCLLGPNGAGKTTAIGIITSLVTKTAGTHASAAPTTPASVRSKCKSKTPTAIKAPR